MVHFKIIGFLVLLTTTADDPDKDDAACTSAISDHLTVDVVNTAKSLKKHHPRLTSEVPRVEEVCTISQSRLR